MDQRAPGTYNVTLVVQDLFLNQAVDNVWVTVIVANSSIPELSSPEDLVFEQGAIEQIITWTVGDRHPDNYTLYLNSALMDSGDWTNGTIAWPVEDLAPDS